MKFQWFWGFWGSKLASEIYQKSIKIWSPRWGASWHRFLMDFRGFSGVQPIRGLCLFGKVSHDCKGQRFVGEMDRCVGRNNLPRLPTDWPWNWSLLLAPRSGTLVEIDFKHYYCCGKRCLKKGAIFGNHLWTIIGARAKCYQTVGNMSRVPKNAFKTSSRYWNQVFADPIGLKKRAVVEICLFKCMR